MASNILAKLAVLISAETAEFKKGLQSAGKDLNDFTNGIKNVAGAVGLAFAGKEIAQFAFDVAKLAGEAEGVRNAFNRLPGATKLMDDLKAATHGTVSELDLMKATMEAAQDDVDVSKLPRLFEFITIKAQQTGKSVEELTKNILDGIGKKSTKKLDDAGISADKLAEAFKGASLSAQNTADITEAVGRIAEQELSKMGPFIETAATSSQQLTASWEDLKVTLGDFVNAAGLPEILKAVSLLVQGLGESLVAMRKIFSKGTFTEMAAFVAGSLSPTGGGAFAQPEVIAALARIHFEEQKHIQKTVDELKKLSDARGAAGGTVVKYGNSIESLREKENQLTKDRDALLDTDRETIALKNIEIAATRRQREELEKLGTELKKVTKAKQDFEIVTGFKDIKDLKPTGVALEISRSVKEKKPKTDPLIDMAGATERAGERISATYEKQGKDLQALSDKQAQLAADEEARQLRIAETAEQVGGIIGDAMGAAISGQQSFADALKGITSQILDLFLKQAIGGIIAGAGKSGAFPPIAIGLAVAGVAAISALFKKATGKSGGGGGGASVSAGRSNGSDRLRANTAVQDTAPTIETILRGQDLFVVMSRFEKNNRQTSTINKRG